MIVIYRGWGLLQFALGVCVFVVLLISGTLTLPLVGVAAFWLYYGRGKLDPESGERAPSPSVYWIPVWFYGAVVVPIALTVGGLELINGRFLAGNDVEIDAPVAEFDASESEFDERVTQTDAPGDPPTGEDRVAATQTLRPARPTTGRPAPVEENLPGTAVTMETEIRPGLRLISKWGKRWYPVEVVGFGQGESLLVDWLGWGNYRSRPKPRSELRLIAEDEWDQYPPYDEPSTEPPGAQVAAASKLSRGQELLCHVSAVWLPVTVKSVEDNGAVTIRWKGFRDSFDETVSRSRLCRDPDAPPGRPVTNETVFSPGQKLAGRSGSGWYQVVVVGVGEHVHVDFVGTRSWQAYGMTHEKVRVVDDDEYAACKLYGDKPPEERPRLPDDATVHVGEVYLCEASGSWITVGIVAVGEDGRFEVDWLGFSPDQNSVVERKRLSPIGESDVSKVRRKLISKGRPVVNVGDVPPGTSVLTEVRPARLASSEKDPLTWRLMSLGEDEAVISRWNHLDDKFDCSIRALYTLPTDVSTSMNLLGSAAE